MNKIRAFIAAVLVTNMLTACNGVGTAGVTETSAETEESITTVSEETTETVSETDTLSAESRENTVETTEKEAVAAITQEQVKAPPPDAEFLLELCNKWLSEDTLENGKSFALDSSPTGTVTALYTDIDGDAIKEFCFIVCSFHASALYVCDYVDTAWEVVDVLDIAENYTYLQTNPDNTMSLFAVVGVRPVEGLRSYVYNNGIEEEFELFDYEAFYDNELETAETYEVMDEIYYKAIEDAVSGYDNLTHLYNLTYYSTDIALEARLLKSDYDVPDGFDVAALQDKLDTFTAEVATLFQ